SGPGSRRGRSSPSRIPPSAPAWVQESVRPGAMSNHGRSHLERDAPAPVLVGDRRDVMPVRLRGARKITDAPRIVDEESNRRSAGERLEPHLRARPGEWTTDAA